MREHSPLLRQWPLLRLLCARHYGATVREMAQEMGVTEKTIRRDLQVFREVGFPIEETAGERGRKTWRMKPLVGQPPMSFAFDEAIALYLGQHLLEPLAGTVFWEASRRAFRKIRASLSTEALRYEEIRHWKIDRVEEATLEELRFQRPDNFDLRKHLSGSFGILRGEGDVHVKVRFAADVARYVQEKTRHPSQKLTPQKGGTLIAEFDLDGTEEIKRWILSFGRHAVVLEPEGLRGEIRDELRTLLGLTKSRGNQPLQQPRSR